MRRIDKFSNFLRGEVVKSPSINLKDIKEDFDDVMDIVYDMVDIYNCQIGFEVPFNIQLDIESYRVRNNKYEDFIRRLGFTKYFLLYIICPKESSYEDSIKIANSLSPIINHLIGIKWELKGYKILHTSNTWLNIETNNLSTTIKLEFAREGAEIPKPKGTRSTGPR